MHSGKCPHCGSAKVKWRPKVQAWECCDCEERFPGPPPADNPDPIADVESTYRSRARALANHTMWIETICTTWPGPIASTYSLLREVLRNGQIDASAFVLKDFIEILARFTVLAMAQDVLICAPEAYQKEVRYELFSKPPSLGDWLRLANKFATWENGNVTGLVFPELAHFWRHGKDRSPLAIFLEKERFVKWRNETLGHGVRGNDLDQTMKDLERFLGDGEDSVHAALRPFADFWQTIRLTDTDGHTLMGAQSIHTETSIGHALGTMRPLFLVRDNSLQRFPLTPFFSGRRCQICDRSETFLYDSTRPSTPCPDFRLWNYERGHPFRVNGSRDPEFQAQYNAIHDPDSVTAKDGFTEDALADDLAAILEAQLVDRNYLSPTYLRAPLLEFLEEGRHNERGGLYWLQAPAHVGKSTFAQGLDPHYRDQLKEESLPNEYAIVVFYIRREYQYHIPQFAETLQEGLRESLGLRAQNAPLPSLELTDPRPESLCQFLAAFQKLGKRPLLVVLDGLDELAEEHPGIADYLPAAKDLPPEVFLLVTSRPIADIPTWLQNKIAILRGAHIRNVGLQDSDYRDLLDKFARDRLDKRLTNLLPELYQKSDGRFLYFSFLVGRLADGDLASDDIGRLANPEQLVPQYLKALQERYAKTAQGDLLQRVLLHLAAGEAIFLGHNNRLPVLAQTPWHGLPMPILCQAIEGQSAMTPRLASTLYLLKPLLGTWRGDNSDPLYRLGIKGLQEIIQGLYRAELNTLYDRHFRQVLEETEQHSSRSADLDWIACHLDGLDPFISEELRQVLRHEKGFDKSLRALIEEFTRRGDDAHKNSQNKNALSNYAVVAAAIQWLNGERPDSLKVPKDTVLLWLRLIDDRGSALLAIGDTRAALADFNQAIRLREGLHQRLGNQFAPDMADGLARAYGNRGNALQMIGDIQGALAAYDQAIALREGLRQSLGNQFAPDMADGLAGAYGNRGSALGARGDTQGALAAYDQAIALGEGLRQSLGNQFAPDMANRLAGAYGNRGNALQMIGDIQGALAAYDVAVALWEDLREKSGGESRKEYAQMLEQIKIMRTQILTNTDAKN